uniref:Uncharacterized protein n=1 Tax=uncultured prokaryote TaxID=198431 RepID=A0A0H5Q5L0_9ZZZZ|nr:hypothetical protein [uncultured prokaryote]
MHEVVTNISMASGGGKVAVMYFDETVPPEECVDYVSDFWTSIVPYITPATTFQVQGSGRDVDEATGALTAFYNVASSALIAGSSSTQQVADATQGLVQWRTGIVLGGREVRGRTFIPGLSQSSVIGGNLAPQTRTGIETNANILGGPITGLGVWRRPKEGTPGQLVQVSTATVWSELAVLRRRRG